MPIVGRPVLNGLVSWFEAFVDALETRVAHGVERDFLALPKLFVRTGYSGRRYIASCKDCSRTAATTTIAWGLLMFQLMGRSTLASANQSNGNNPPNREMLVLLEALVVSEAFPNSTLSEQVAGSLHVDCLLKSLLGPLTLRADDIPNVCSFLTPSI